MMIGSTGEIIERKKPIEVLGRGTLIARQRLRIGPMTLEVELEQRMRRQVAMYFSIVRRKACWASFVLQLSRLLFVVVEFPQRRRSTLATPEKNFQMRTGSFIMHDGPVAALPVQQQPDRHIYPQAVGVPLDDLQGQVPLLTQSFTSQRGTMSEPVPLLSCAPDPVASHAQRWMELKTDHSSTCDKTKPDLKQNRDCGSSQSSHAAPGSGQNMEVSDRDDRAAVHSDFKMETHCEATPPQQQDREAHRDLLS
ncbi:hypothetical protein INR49_011317 [Caranx melampygus]|nr:hypothetical protein INR49_011317 [Caranx melampygus]